MTNFFEHIPFEEADRMERLSRLMFELRENRAKLLRQYNVGDEAGLLKQIVSGVVPEHPAYDHYLGALAIAQTREAASEALKNLLKEMGG